MKLPKNKFSLKLPLLRSLRMMLRLKRRIQRMMAPPLVFRLKTIYASFEMPSPSTLCPVSCSQLLVCPNPSYPTTCPRADQSSLLIFVYMVDAHLVVFKRTPPACTLGGSTWVIVSSVPSVQRGKPDGGHPDPTTPM